MDTSELRATMLQAILAQGIGMDQAIRDAEAAVAYVLSGPKQEAPPSLPKRGPARTNMILDMWAAGYASKDIAARFEASQKAIFGVLVKARHDGDQRAVLRKKLTPQQRADKADHMRAVRLRGRTA